MHQFAPEQIKAYRAAVDDAKSGAALVKIIEGLGDLKLGEATRKKLPKGIAADHPRAGLFLIDGLHVVHEEKMPRAVHTAKFVDAVPRYLPAGCAGQSMAVAPGHQNMRTWFAVGALLALQSAQAMAINWEGHDEWLDDVPRAEEFTEGRAAAVCPKPMPSCEERARAGQGQFP